MSLTLAHKMERRVLFSPGTRNTRNPSLAEQRCPQRCHTKQQPKSAAPAGKGKNTAHRIRWEQERGVNCATEGEMLELNPKKFLGKFAAFPCLTTFGNGSDSSFPSDLSGAEAVWGQGREGMTS